MKNEPKDMIVKDVVIFGSLLMIFFLVLKFGI